MSILNPAGTCSCAPFGAAITRGGLIASTDERGAGKSSTIIFRRTPGASVVQSPIAALPVSTFEGASVASAASPEYSAVVSPIKAKIKAIVAAMRRCPSPVSLKF